MDTYEKYVKAIKKITKINVPVILNSDEADYSGGAYAGFCGYEQVIIPRWHIENGMFEFEDFLEQEHIKYYHIGLPSVIFNKGRGEKIMKEILKSLDIPYSIQAVEVFIILHEFGHAHDLFYRCKGNLSEYLKTREERKQAVYALRESGLDNYTAQKRYRQIPTEKYADDFAKKYIHQVLNSLNII